MRQDIRVNLMAADHNNRQTQWHQLFNHCREPNTTLLMRQQCFVPPHPTTLTTTQKANTKRLNQTIHPSKTNLRLRQHPKLSQQLLNQSQAG
jgi:hypothetical protein